jgi:hypothetical protein
MIDGVNRQQSSTHQSITQHTLAHLIYKTEFDVCLLALKKGKDLDKNTEKRIYVEFLAGTALVFIQYL